MLYALPSEKRGVVKILKQYQQHERENLQALLSTFVQADDVATLMGHFDAGWLKLLNHGDFKRWSSGLLSLPKIEVTDIELKTSVRVGTKDSCDTTQTDIEASLKALFPWRKGPFDILGVRINTEWRSDWKWDRVLPHLSPLAGKRVLDMGCGSGYHMWRMLGEGAKSVVGIDTSSLFALQFAVMKRYLPHADVFYLPTGIDEMPGDMQCFDTVFSMGILYHRREPIEHLLKAKSLLAEGGEFVLETLVVDGDEQRCLMPHKRYAKMKNVWFIPSVAMLEIWLKRAGFSQVSCVDLNVTSTEEQRCTDWMQFESLADYLDPNDPSLTVEGYPAPKRAVMIAKV